MREAAAKFENGHFTASHPAYREHLDLTRALLCDISLLLAEDAAKTSHWLRDRKSLDWFSRFFLAHRLHGCGKDASDAVLEAAKDFVRMYAVHQEYVMLEAAPKDSNSKTVGGSGRYRTEVA